MRMRIATDLASVGFRFKIMARSCLARARQGLAAVACALAFPPCGFNDAQAEQPPLIFGVLNQQSPIKTAERWNPILSYLTQKTGIPLRLKMGTTVNATDAMMGREEFDLAFSNHVFQAEFDGKYDVIARWAGRPIHAVIAVPEHGPARRLEDLRGRTVAFPSPEAFAGYAVPMKALRDGNIEVNAVFAGNQDGALARLKLGMADAAAVNSRFLDQYAEREGLRHRRIFVAGPFHDMPVVARKRLPAASVDALRRALLGMRNDPAAASALAQAGCQGFAAATDADYDDARHAYRAIGQ